MDKKIILITTQYEAERFETFLALPDNHRILFSGKYGSGKTYFLHEFFTTRKKDEYEFFHLFPTNYAIAKNEDVVKLLQFDILYELLVKGYLAPSEKMFSTKETIASFVQSNLPKIIKDVVSHCGKIGKKLSDVFDTYTKWAAKYEDFDKGVKQSEEDKAREAFYNLMNEVEYNATTELIEMVNSTIDKQKVLIVDDLDRIDPEHIFRLLNLFSAQTSNYFSAHWPINQDENRYGFDKIIFVCDIDNIRNIFRAKYGDGVDFAGYIDKFYSIAPYFFNNNNMVAQEAHRFVASINSEWPIQSREQFSSLVRMLLFHNVITLRKLKEKEFAPWEYPLRKYPALGRDFNTFSVGLLDFILFLYGTKEDAIAAIKKHNEEISLELMERSGYLLTDLLIPFLYPDATLTVGEGFIYENKLLDLKISYKCEKYDRDTYAEINTVSKLDGSERKKIPFFQLLSIAIENYCRLIEVQHVILY